MEAPKFDKTPGRIYDKMVADGLTYSDIMGLTPEDLAARYDLSPELAKSALKRAQFYEDKIAYGKYVNDQ